VNYPWAADLAAWLSAFTGAGISVARISVTKAWAESEIVRLQDERYLECLKPYMGMLYFLDDLIAGFRVLTWCHPDHVAYLCGFPAVVGPDDQDCPFVIVPRRDRLIFGASA
jgi:hypothetical protein